MKRRFHLPDSTHAGYHKAKCAGDTHCRCCAATDAAEATVLFCVSTYGEGDPPDMAVQFWDDLQKLPFDALQGMSYAIYALGDSTYTDFCGFGKKFDTELASHGAQCFAGRADNDLDYEAGIDSWCSVVFDALPGSPAPASA
jgi:sulfite reductase (NADPH) flavoprotein alpha-component